MNKCVIFDLDGTLFDSMKFWEGIGREFLTQYGVTEFPADFLDKVKRMSVAESCEYFREAFHIDASDDEISNAMRDMVADKYRYEAEFKPNVRETLDVLMAHGVRMGIATATYQELVGEALVRLNATKYFEFILSCNEVGRSKSDPLIYNEAMHRLGGDKTNTVILEDSLHAITTAKADGFKVIAVSEPRHSAELPRIRALADKYLEVMDAESILTI